MSIGRWNLNKKFSNWKYENNIINLKVKVLFLNLFQMEKEEDNLKLLSTFHEFRIDEIQLDHKGRFIRCLPTDDSNKGD